MINNYLILIDKITFFIYLTIMGIGFQALSIFDELLDNNTFIDSNSVIEMGSQLIDTPFQKHARYILNKHNKKINTSEFLSAKDFYFSIGFNKYKSIDASGKYESLIFDLNQNLVDKYKFKEKFDLVTNFGTSEHVFNQKSVFQNIHNLTKNNGYMIHILPFEGGINHCYFNYHPNFFYDLGLYNKYELIGFWYFSQRSYKFLRTYSGYNYFKPLKYNNDLIDQLNKLFKEKKLLHSPFEGSSLGVMYKKINENEFNIPFDHQKNSSISGIDNKLNEYKINDLNLNKNIEINAQIDHKKQIDEILGGIYWKIILKKILFNRDFRRKFFAKILFKFFKYKSKYLTEDSIFIK